MNQIVNRIVEKRKQGLDKKKLENYPLLTHPCSEDTTTFSRITLSEGFTLQNIFSDMWFFTKNKKVIAMVYANNIGVFGKELKNTEPQFESPLKSPDLNVFCSFADNNFEPSKFFACKEILCKLVAIPIYRKTVYVPLQHTLGTVKL